MQYLLTRTWDDRALNAYFRRAAREGIQFQQPTAPDTYTNGPGHHLVVLYNRNNILAVYSVGADDRLRWMDEEKWPKRLTGLYHGH